MGEVAATATETQAARAGTAADSPAAEGVRAEAAQNQQLGRAAAEAAVQEAISSKAAAEQLHESHTAAMEQTRVSFASQAEATVLSRRKVSQLDDLQSQACWITVLRERLQSAEECKRGILLGMSSEGSEEGQHQVQGWQVSELSIHGRIEWHQAS